MSEMRRGLPAVTGSAADLGEGYAAFLRTREAASRAPLSPRLAKVLAVANRAGTPGEAAAAIDRAAAVAARDGVEVVEGAAGDLIALDPARADVHRALMVIADDNPPVCCGDPGDCARPCDEKRNTVCICDPELLALEVYDLRCPTHGLVKFLRESLMPKETTQ